MKNNVFVFLTALFLTSSCVYSRMSGPLKKEFAAVYTNQNTGLDSLLNINGYFTEWFLKENEDLGGKVYFVDSIRQPRINFMFLPNGLCMYGYYDSPHHEVDFLKVRTNRKKNIYYKSGTTFCGFYTLFNDTIHVKLVNRPTSLTRTWMAFEAWYKIIDKNTLQIIAHREITTSPEQRKNNSAEIKSLDNAVVSPASFTPIAEIPFETIAWLVEKKWFWHNAEDYENWNKK